MILKEEALKAIIEATKLLDIETVNLLSSLNRVLAQDIYSKDNLPPFDKSGMDGYAIRSEDIENCSAKNPGKLRIKGIIKAGDYYLGELQPGEAIKIMTGAPLPKGADTVIQIEKVEVSENEVSIFEAMNKGKNILKMGEEIREGELAIPKGKKIRPSEIGMLASLGYSRVKTYRVPKIIILITGDEIIGIDEELTPGKVRNCNEYSLLALIKNLQVDVKSYGVIKDDINTLFRSMKQAFEEGDIVITTGGVSVGDYDFVESSLEKLGVDIKFTSVAIKPGKPITFAKYKDKLFFGLPGNPLAVINSFEQFVGPAIKKMMGSDYIETEVFPVILADEFKTTKGRINHVYVYIKKENNHYYAHKIGEQGSNQLLTVSKSNGIIIVDENTTIAKAGDVLNGRFIFN